MKRADEIHNFMLCAPSLLWDELNPRETVDDRPTMRRTRRIRISNVAIFIILDLLLLLHIRTCDSYMSTLHLGRAVKALKTAEQWQQQQQQQFNDECTSNSTSISKQLDMEAGEETITSVKAREVTTPANEQVVGDNSGMDDKSPTTKQPFPTAEQSSPMGEKLSITAEYISKEPIETGDQEASNHGIEGLTSLEPVNHPTTVEQSPGTGTPKGLDASVDAQAIDHDIQRTTPPERGNPQALEGKPAPHQPEIDLPCEIVSEALAATLSNQVYLEACQGSSIGASPSRSKQEKDHNTDMAMEVRVMVPQEVFSFRAEVPPGAVGVIEGRGLQSLQVEPLDPRGAPGTKHQGPGEDQMAGGKREEERGGEVGEEDTGGKGEHREEKREGQEGQIYPDERTDEVNETIAGERKIVVRVEEDDKGKDVMGEHKSLSGEEDIQRPKQQRDKEKELHKGREAGEVSSAREETLELGEQEEEGDEKQRVGAHEVGYEERDMQEDQGGEEVNLEDKGGGEKQEESVLDEKGGKREGGNEPIIGMVYLGTEGDEQEVEEMVEQRDGTEDQSSEAVLEEEARRDGRQDRLRGALGEGDSEEDVLIEDGDDEKDEYQECPGYLEHLCESEGICSRMECLCTKLRYLKDLAELEDELSELRAESWCDAQLEEEGEWQGGELVVDAEGSDVDGFEEATQELLRVREAQDVKVREAAAHAAEGLPVTQRECYDDLEAFAFGGGLSEEDAGTLDAMAICGDRIGLVLAFLRQWRFNVQRAKEAMRRCCTWRRRVEANAVFSRQASLAQSRGHRSHWPMGVHRWDRSGRPVFYSRVGQTDLDGLDKEDMVDNFCLDLVTQFRFTLAQLSREAERPVDRMTVVFDLKGLGERQAKAEVVLYCVRRIIEILRDNNVFEMASDLIVVDTPSWLAWHVIEEGVLDEEVKAKVRIFGEEKSVALELEAYIPRRNIPDFLGGDSPSALGSDADSLWTEVDAAPAAGTNGEDPFLDDLAMGKACHRAETLDDVGSSPSRGTTGRKATAVAPGGETVEEVKGGTQRTRNGRVAATCDRKSRSSRRHGERREGSAASCTPRQKGEVKRRKEGRAGEGEIGSGGTLTALREVFKRVLGGILVVGEALLRVVESILRLLRNLFFEQVEVEEF